VAAYALKLVHVKGITSSVSQKSGGIGPVSVLSFSPRGLWDILMGLWTVAAINFEALSWFLFGKGR